MDLVTAVKSCLRHYATFSGRARRSEFWFFVLAKSIASLAVNIVGGIVWVMVSPSHGLPLAPAGHPFHYDPGSFYRLIPSLIVTLALLLPSIAVEVRRLHDIGRSGWWWWLNLMPVLGGLWLLYWDCRAGTDGANRFGPDPLAGSMEPRMIEPIEAVRSCISRYATFRGRASRAEYWFFVLFTGVVMTALFYVMMIVFVTVTFAEGAFEPGARPGPFSIIVGIGAFCVVAGWWLAMFLPTLAVGVRRLHDIGRSGWWYWLYHIPLVGFVLYLIWNCERGTVGPNRYGDDPLRPRLPGPWRGPASGPGA